MTLESKSNRFIVFKNCDTLSEQGLRVTLELGHASRLQGVKSYPSIHFVGSVPASFHTSRE